MKTFHLIILCLSFLASVHSNEIAYLKPIDTVLQSHPSGNTLSMPLSRLDIMVKNGIAFCRLTQQVYNPSDNLERASLRMPMPDDAIVSRFRIWDRGEKYEGTLDERKTVEKVYREVSGDHVPDLDQEAEERIVTQLRAKDPGIARQSHDLFELRVAPIFPKETKQIQLYWQFRLNANKQGFRGSFDLSRLRSMDHDDLGQLSAENFEVRISYLDDKPILNIEGIPASKDWTLYRKTAHAFHLEVINPSISVRRLNYSMALDWSKGPDTWLAISETESEKRFLIRLCDPQNQKLTAYPNEPFYIGCWRTKQNLNETHNSYLSDFTTLLEYQAFATLTAIAQAKPNQRFSFSYYPYPKDETDFPFEDSLIKENVQFKDFLNLLQQSSNGKKEKETIPFQDILNHLEIQFNKGTKKSLLFIDHLSSELFQNLTQIAKQYRGAHIYLHIQTIDPDIKDNATCSIFHHKNGWLSPNINSGHFLKTNQLDPLIQVKLDFLSHIDPSSLPIHFKTSQKEYQHISLERIGDVRSPVRWISGSFKNRFEDNLIINGNIFNGLLSLNDGYFELPLNQAQAFDGGLWAGAFSARHQIRQLYPPRPSLRRGSRRTPPKVITNEQILTIQKHSKHWSFLTPYTAFIALPGELENQFGFQPEKRSHKKHLGSQLGVGTPEPSTWCLIFAVGIMLWIKLRKPISNQKA